MAAEMTGFRTVTMPPFRVIGREIRGTKGFPEGNPIRALWHRCFKDGTMATLEGHPDRIHRNAMVGWMGRCREEDKTFSYMVGVLTQPTASVPKGMDVADVPSATFAVCTIRGTEPDIYERAHELMASERKRRSLSYDMDLGMGLEWYDERFESTGGQTRIIDLYEPVKEPQEVS